MARNPPGETKDRILRAGMKLFASKGFDGVSIRELAKQAKVTQPMIYHHFGDKKGAYAAVVTHVFSAKGAEGRRVLAAFSSPEDQVYAFVTWLVNSFMHDKVYSRLMHLETIRNPSSVSRRLTEQMCPPNYEQLAELMQRLSPRDDSVSLAFSLYAVSLGFTMFMPFVRRMSVKEPDFASVDAVVLHILALVFPARTDLHRSRGSVRSAMERVGRAPATRVASATA